MKYDLFSENIRERFVPEWETKNSWGSCSVKIIDKKENRTVYEYERNYSFLETFEPFRILDEADTWHHFGLISPQYTTFQLIDLDSGKLVAENPAPKLTKEQAERLNSNSKNKQKYSEGQEFPSWGFCPVSFHVPDFLDILDGPVSEEFNEGELEEYYRIFESKRNFGFMSGCIWGDDSSWKLRAIDLSEIKSNKITSDERFGYFELPGMPLKEIYDKNFFFYEDFNSLKLKTEISFKLDSNGKTESATLYSTIPNLKI